MKHKNTILAIVIGLLLAGSISFAQMGPVTPPTLWKKVGSAIFPVKSAWEFGSNAARIAKGWFTDLDVSGVFTLGGIVGPGGIDMDGEILILDADGDTSITADTDDQIDFEIAGVDVISISASTTSATVIDISAATSTKISLPDDKTDALDITESANSYLKFVTTNAGEKITLGKKLEAGSVEIEGSAFDINGGTVDLITSLTVANNVDIGNFTLQAKGLLADDLTSGQVVFAGASGLLSDDSDFTFLTDTLTVTNFATTTLVGKMTAGATEIEGSYFDINGGTIDDITVLTIANNVDVGNFNIRALSFTADSLTSGRVPIISTDGLLIDDGDLTFITDTLTATKLVVSDTLTVNSTSTTHTIMPATDSLYSLGSSAVRWVAGYFDALYVSTMSWIGNLDMDGNLVLNIGSADTDFTSGGGLNIATDLDVGATLKVGTSDAFQVNATGNLTNVNAITWDLNDSNTSALNIESGLLNFDTTNTRIGIATTTPSTTLEVVGTVTATEFVGGGGGLTDIVTDAFEVSCKVNEAGGISKGQCVYQSGATGQKPQVSLCDNTNASKHDFYGIAAETKTDGQTIIIRTSGVLTGVDTDGTGVPGTTETWADGDPLYMSTAGNFTDTTPTSGTVEQVVNVTYAHGTVGILNTTRHEAHYIAMPSGSDLDLRMGDSAGSNYVLFEDYTDNIVGWINSDGIFQTGADGFDGQLNIYSEQGGTDYTVSILANATTTENYNIQLPVAAPGATYLLNMTSAGIMGYDTNTYLTSSTGALRALSNLSSVAINESLISDAANADDLGSEATYWKKLYLASELSFEGSTDNDHQTTISVTDPTSDRTITLQNATGIVVMDNNAVWDLEGAGLSIAGGQLSAHVAMTISGEDYLSLTTQAITMNAINPDNLANDNFGDWSCNGTTCTINTDAITDLHIDWGLGANQISLIDLPDVGTATTTAGSVLVADGSDYKGVAISGDMTIGADGTVSIASAVIVEADLDADEVPTDNDILTYDNTGANFSWQTPAELTLPTLSSSDTLTNKRIDPRVGTVADAATITPTGDASDVYTVTALAQGATIAAPSGTPVNGQKLILRIKDNGTTRALTWNAIYNVVGVTLPTDTTAGKTHYIGLIYNSANSKWDVIAAVEEA